MENANDWAPSPDHPGYLCKTIHRKACTVAILRPMLSHDEQTRRMASIKQAAARLVLETEKSKIIKHRRKA